VIWGDCNDRFAVKCNLVASSLQDTSSFPPELNIAFHDVVNCAQKIPRPISSLESSETQKHSRVAQIQYPVAIREGSMIRFFGLVSLESEYGEQWRKAYEPHLAPMLRLLASELQQLISDANLRRQSQKLIHSLRHDSLLDDFLFAVNRAQFLRCQLWEYREQLSTPLLRLLVPALRDIDESLRLGLKTFASFTSLYSPYCRWNSKPTDVAKLVDGVLDIMEPSLEGMKIRRNYRNLRGRMIRIDSDLYHLLLRNLIRNSVQSIRRRLPVGGQLRKIHIRQAVANESLCLTIEDDGVGLTDTERNHLKQGVPFSRRGGSGIGFQVIRKIVDLASGQIDLGKPFKRGAKIRISLPLQPKT
jgi:K+-sensing histidine kinase KdpD